MGIQEEIYNRVAFSCGTMYNHKNRSLLAQQGIMWLHWSSSKDLTSSDVSFSYTKIHSVQGLGAIQSRGLY